MTDACSMPLLLTASVSTRGMRGALFSDEEREAMYESALRFYCRKLLLCNPGQIIVFVENSGFNLAPVRERLLRDFPAAAAQIEFISLNPNLFDISRGKGYNEALSISLAIAQSTAIKSAGCFFKATGRYPIFNIDYFIRSASAKFNRGIELYADVKDHNLYHRLGLKWTARRMDTRLFAMTVDFWQKEIAPGADAINDVDYYLESYCFDRCRHTSHSASLRFGREPHLGGVAGHSGPATLTTSSHQGPKATAKRLLANALRCLIPGFWF